MSVYTNAVSFVTAWLSLRLHLLFTRRRSKTLPKPGRFENADKRGAFSKRYGFSCRVNGETASINLNTVTILARNFTGREVKSNCRTSAVLLTLYSLITFKLSTGVLLPSVPGQPYYSVNNLYNKKAR